MIVNCEFLANLYHPIFFDTNQNGIRDIGESFYSLGSVLIEPLGINSFANPVNGGFAILPFGNYSISLDIANFPGWQLTSSPNPNNVVIDLSNPVDTVYFGLFPTGNISENTVTIAADFFRCNEFVDVDVIATNNGTTYTTGTIWLELDEFIEDFQFTIPPDTMASPHKIGWNFTGFPPGNILKKNMEIEIPGPLDFTLGDSLFLNSYITYEDINGAHETDMLTYAGPVFCSYDPNDKLVSPVYRDNFGLFSERLFYTCLLYTSPSPRDQRGSRMPSSA